MAWTNFQKSNWTRTAVGEHARQYFTAVAAGITITAATSQLVTVTASFQFQGNGQCEVSFPFGAGGGQTAAAQGLMLGNAWLLPPASGSYSAGNHPLLVFQVTSQTLMTVASGGISVIGVQY
jgi:hypothetical protein